MRRAEALVACKGPRAETGAAVQSVTLSAELGAEPLHTGALALARRSRVSLETLVPGSASDASDTTDEPRFGLTGREL